MSSLFLSFLAAGCSASSSFFFRKNADHAGRSPSGYLFCFYSFAFLLAFLLHPSIWKTPINFIILSLGACVGLLNSTLMLFSARALKEGPAGLTFAFQNASAIFPGIILFLLLGSSFGFCISAFQWVGIGLVLLGLFLGARHELHSSKKASSRWLKYAFCCFAFQVCALTLIQARAVLFDEKLLDVIQISPAQDVWFMPGQFGASLLLQGILFLKEKKNFKKREVAYGCLGGLANSFSTTLLLLATKWALPVEKGIIFPSFAITAMILCNIWANRVYKERFNFKTNALCSSGIFLAAFT